MAALGILVATHAACGTDNCTRQSCADWGGTAARSLYSCYSSGSGSVDDEFWIEDEDGEEVYKCTRPADDNNGCGVELINAKESYCRSATAAREVSTISEDVTMAHE